MSADPVAEAGKRLGRSLFRPDCPWFVGVIIDRRARNRKPTLCVLSSEKPARVAPLVPSLFEGLRVRVVESEPIFRGGRAAISNTGTTA